MFQVIKTTPKQQARLIASLSTQGQLDPFFRGRCKVLQILKTPKSFNVSSIADFLSDFCQFQKEHSHDYAFTLSFDSTKKIDLVGMILLYKIIAYSSTVMKLKEPHMVLTPYIQGELERYGMYRLINSYLRRKKDINNAYNSLHKVEEDNFFIFPRRLSPKDEGHNADVKNAFLDAVSQYYKGKDLGDRSVPVGDCIGEIIGNYRAHSEDESETVVAAQGSVDSFTLVIADSGAGIVSTLKEYVDEKSPEKILEAAIKRGTSSKKHTSNHMGYGLFHVAELAKIHRGRLTIWSEGVYLDVSHKKTTSKKCGFWQGTIISVTLQLSNPFTVKDIPYYQNRGASGLKINFI